MKKVLVILCATLMSLFASPFAKVDKIEGMAKVQHDGSIKKMKIAPGFELTRGDTILTYKSAKVVLTMEDKTKIVINEYAKLKLLSQDRYDQEGGRVYFKVTKRKGASGLKVSTPFAIIGVKGTEFVVTNTEKEKALALNEGLVGVDSPDDKPFAKVDKDKVDQQLAGSPQAVNAEFEAYKKQIMAEFTEYVKSFDLHPGKKLTFDGHTVMESSQDDSDSQMFKTFMSDAEFNAISDELEKDVTSEVKSSDQLDSDPFFSEE